MLRFSQNYVQILFLASLPLSGCSIVNRQSIVTQGIETWLVAGQSNMEAGTMPFAFSHHMRINGHPIAILEGTRGRTMIDCWRKGGSCYDKNIVPYLGHTVTGILFWQGESNCRDYTGETWKDYGNQFRALIAEFRADFGNIPFIFVTLQRYNPNLTEKSVAIPGTKFDEPTEWKTCRKNQLTALTLPDVFSVETEDITNGDVHPIYAYDEIGRRAAEIALKLKSR